MNRLICFFCVKYTISVIQVNHLVDLLQPEDAEPDVLPVLVLRQVRHEPRQVGGSNEAVRVPERFPDRHPVLEEPVNVQWVAGVVPPDAVHDAPLPVGQVVKVRGEPLLELDHPPDVAGVGVVVYTLDSHGEDQQHHQHHQQVEAG